MAIPIGSAGANVIFFLEIIAIKIKFLIVHRLTARLCVGICLIGEKIFLDIMYLKTILTAYKHHLYYSCCPLN